MKENTFFSFQVRLVSDKRTQRVSYIATLWITGSAIFCSHVHYKWTSYGQLNRNMVEKQVKTLIA